MILQGLTIYHVLSGNSVTSYHSRVRCSDNIEPLHGIRFAIYGGNAASLVHIKQELSRWLKPNIFSLLSFPAWTALCWSTFRSKERAFCMTGSSSWNDHESVAYRTVGHGWLDGEEMMQHSRIEMHIGRPWEITSAYCNCGDLFVIPGAFYAHTYLFWIPS